MPPLLFGLESSKLFLTSVFQFKELQSEFFTRKYLSVHFIIPKADICRPIISSPLPNSTQCEWLNRERKNQIERLKSTEKAELEIRKFIDYPVNFARNFARRVTNF